jgi:hypothetical protein
MICMTIGMGILKYMVISTFILEPISKPPTRNNEWTSKLSE